MLKHRLLIGIPLAVVFVSLLVWDGFWDGSITRSPADDRYRQGTLFLILVCIFQIVAHLELNALARAAGAEPPIFLPMVGAIFLCLTWYACGLGLLFGFVLVGTLFTVLLSYYAYRGVAGILTNGSVAAFSLLYLGVLGAFAVGLRTDFGVWPLLMFVFVVKFSDVGAYALGRTLGKRKLAPRLSPGKTWEGLVGAALVAALVALGFSQLFGIMPALWSVFFGVAVALLGQVGDLAESMLKRDVGVKDSSSVVPGFGGVLDMLDSPLATAPLAYAFFWLLN